ncbi:MAG: rubredoxin [Syntrophales bacterium]
MSKYICEICGYIYDPEKGDSSGGIPAGTPFEKLPDSWRCPICGVDKTMFKKMS